MVGKGGVSPFKESLENMKATGQMYTCTSLLQNVYAKQ